MSHELPPTTYEPLGVALDQAATAAARGAVNTASELALTNFDTLNGQATQTEAANQHVQSIADQHGPEVVQAAADMAHAVQARESEETAKTAKLQDTATMLSRAVRLGIRGQLVTDLERRQAVLERGLASAHLKEHHSLERTKQALHGKTRDALLDNPFDFWGYSSPEAEQAGTDQPQPTPEPAPEPQPVEEPTPNPEPEASPQPDEDHEPDNHDQQPDESGGSTPEADSDILAELRGLRQDAADRDARDRAERDAAIAEREQALADRQDELARSREADRERKINRRQESYLLSGNVYEVYTEIEDPRNPGHMIQLTIPMRAMGKVGSVSMAESSLLITDSPPDRLYRMKVMTDGMSDDFDLLLPESAFSSMESYNVLDENGNPRRSERSADFDAQNPLLSGATRDMLSVIALADSLYKKLSSSPVIPARQTIERVIAVEYRPYIREITERFSRLAQGEEAPTKLTQLKEHVTRESKKSRRPVPLRQRQGQIIDQLFDSERVAEVLKKTA